MTIKTIPWIFLYVTALIPFGLSILYFSEKNLLSALIASSISMGMYTFIIRKDVKFLSFTSFITMLLTAFLTLAAAAEYTNGVYSSIFDEKMFKVALPLLTSVILINSVFWVQKKGLKKLLSSVCIFLSVLLLLLYGTVSPEYYQNFVYTRICILILLIFSIYLIKKKKKALGVLGIFLSISILLLSTAMFAQKTYILEENEKKEVIAYVDPMAKEMFSYYNKEDYVNFCKYCGLVLRNMLNKNPIDDNRIAYGPYVYFDEPSKVIRKAGRFYVEYPVKFQNVKNPMYVTFVTENISSDPIMYGFSFSDKEGGENEN